MKIIQHFPYSVTLPEIIDRQRRGWRWVQEQSKRKRNNVELIFVFKYKVDLGKLSNFVSTINWSKKLSKGLAKAKLISQLWAQLYGVVCRILNVHGQCDLQI